MKKRMFAGIAMLLCLCILAGCKEQSNVREDFSADGFIEFLDNENFVPGISQGAFKEQLGNYSLDGQSVSELVSGGMFYDGTNGGGYQAHGKSCGMDNDFHVDEGQSVATYTNKFYTYVPLEGLQLPYGIDFTDDLNSVLSKVGILRSAEELTEDIRLWQDGYLELAWQKGTDETCSGTLLFTQEYGIAKEDGRPCKVVRTVAFSFLSESGLLSKAEFSVIESYPHL